MVKRLLLALLLIPLADALFLVFVADAIGWQITVLLVVLTGLVGMLFVRSEGRHTLRKIQQKLAAGDIPTDELMDGGFLIAAGAFLLTPGLVTDALGFLFVVPFTRAPIRELVKRLVVKPYLEKRTDGMMSGNVYTFGFPNADANAGPGTGTGSTEDTYDLGPDAYDVEFEDEDE